MSIDFLRRIAGWLVPTVLTGVYIGLIEVMDASFGVSMIALAGLAMVLLLWFFFRELATHAALSRLVAVGEPDELVAKARNAIDHRFTRRGKLPFRIYEAIGLGLRGQWRESLAALADLGAGGAAGWRLYAAAARIAALTELGDAPAARAVLDGEVAPLARRAGAAGHIVMRDCEARVAFAENARSVARPLFRAIADDVRLGPAQRATARLYLGRCLAADGDRDAARSELEEASRLAPRTWVRAAAEHALDTLA